MFNKLKQIKDLRSQAKTMQTMLASESVSYEKSGVTISMDGNMAITSLTIADKNIDNLEKVITECFNEVVKKVQKVMAKKMQEMGGMPNLGDLFKS